MGKVRNKKMRNNFYSMMSHFNEPFVHFGNSIQWKLFDVKWKKWIGKGHDSVDMSIFEKSIDEFDSKKYQFIKVENIQPGNGLNLTEFQIFKYPQWREYQEKTSHNCNASFHNYAIKEFAKDGWRSWLLFKNLETYEYWCTVAK